MWVVVYCLVATLFLQWSVEHAPPQPVPIDLWPNCSSLRPSQSHCDSPVFDSSTGVYVNCSTERKTLVNCNVIDGVYCNGNRTWTEYAPCYYT